VRKIAGTIPPYARFSVSRERVFDVDKSIARGFESARKLAARQVRRSIAQRVPKQLEWGHEVCGSDGLPIRRYNRAIVTRNVEMNARERSDLTSGAVFHMFSPTSS